MAIHSIIFKYSPVEDVLKDIHESHVGGCGITDEVSQWMENIQNSAVEELPEPMSKDVDAAQKLHKKRTATSRNIPEEGGIITAHADGPIADNNEKGNATGAVTKKSKNSKNYKKSTSTMTGATFQQNSTSSPSIVAHPPKKYNSHNIHSDKVNHHRTSSDTNNSNNSNNSNNNQNNNGANDDFKYPHQKYSKEANFRATLFDPETGRQFEPNMDDNWHEKVHERVRRASGSPNASGRREDNKNTCSLYIQTDPLIWRHIREGIADHDRGRKYEIDIKTREEITSLIAHHVTAVNYIYRNTKFDGRTEHRNIRFEVQRIKIDDDSACRTSYNGPHNAFCNEHMDVSNFLNLHSLEDHSLLYLDNIYTHTWKSVGP